MAKFGALLQKIKDSGQNMRGEKSDLVYIVEARDWAIKKVGQELTKELNHQKLIASRIATTPLGLKQKIIHFGSLPAFLQNGRLLPRVHSSNKIIVTCFHLDPEKTSGLDFSTIAKRVSFFHTSCQITKKALAASGAPSQKISVIPLGVNLKIFHPCRAPREKIKARKMLGIPENRFVIGSFQKDGVGWGRGRKPKLIKGPDIFLQTMAALKKYQPFVLLTGPSRGYVKKELKKQNIPFRHYYFKNDSALSFAYRTLDLYLIASRLEGGPLSLLESWASGVPLVGAKAGMIPDIAQNNKNILWAEAGNLREIIAQTRLAIKHPNLRLKLSEAGLAEARKYSWKKIALRYWQEIYAKILS
ncbi:MAG: glycosyltransferase family 4 protein [bacterium]|nr:glycosyltransferase family 4 protein [bacterium]